MKKILSKGLKNRVNLNLIQSLTISQYRTLKSILRKDKGNFEQMFKVILEKTKNLQETLNTGTILVL